VLRSRYCNVGRTGQTVRFSVPSSDIARFHLDELNPKRHKELSHFQRLELHMGHSRETAAEITETTKRPFPVVPTTKILALGRFTSPPTPEQLKTIFPKEVPATLRLYLTGKIDQWWARQDQKGPVFLMNVTSVEEARTILEKLPLGQAKLMEFEYVELSPLTPLHLLLTEG
jgi:hypothetical protein